MRSILLAVLAAAILFSCKNMETKTDESGFTVIEVQNDAITYDETRKDTSVEDEFFGTKVADPYRWLEDDNSEETAEWVKAENAVTSAYMNNIPFRDAVRSRLEEVYNYEKVSSPYKEGEYTYFSKNDGLQNQSVTYRKKGDGEEEIFLDPNTFSDDGTTSLAGLSFTKDGSKAAYLISEGGSDWRKAIVINTDNKEQIEDTLTNIKFSGISWKGNDGFYYSSYDKPEGSELSAKTDQHKVYYHKLGTPQSADKVIFGGTADQKHRYTGAYTTEDEQYLIISASVSTSGNKLFLKDLSNPNSEMVTVLADTKSDTYVVTNEGSKLYLSTNREAPNQKVVTVDAADPAPENWVDFIPETENVLNPSSGGGYIFANYMVDAVSKVMQYDMDGKLVREIKLPGVGSAGGFGGKKEEKEMYFGFTNYNTPGSSYKFNADTGEYESYWKPDIDFDSDAYTSEQVFYTSKDGTKVPMIITYKKGLEKDGQNPTILYGYGGFNISLRPSFSVINSVWLEQGGIYAVPNLRGGGEYGKKWHDAGTQLKKQNVFDDFIAAAEYLIDEGYTSSEKLAVSGRSNGGLLVGATMTQRPDLMKVALPGVGVLDMLRYHTFTAGAGWAYDYGTADQSQEMFEYLKAYSPVHNVKEDVEYPATFVTTGDHDDRVVPAHSFKFAAELQDKHKGDNPVLIRIETNAGHGAGKPTGKILDEWADTFSFTMYNMGVQPSY